MNKRESHPLVICSWNVCLGSKYKLQTIINFIKEYNIDILCVQEAEIDPDDNFDIYQIPGFNLEIEANQPHFNMRTSMYIKSEIKYKRRDNIEGTENHIIAVTLTEGNIGLASIYRTYKLTHKTSYEEAIEEQIEVLKNFCILT